MHTQPGLGRVSARRRTGMSRKAKIGDTTLLRFSSRSVGDVAIPFPERGDSCGHTFSSITAVLRRAVNGCPGTCAAATRYSRRSTSGLNPVDFQVPTGEAARHPAAKASVWCSATTREVIAVGSDVQRFAWGTVCLPGPRRIVRAHSLSSTASTRTTRAHAPESGISRRAACLLRPDCSAGIRDELGVQPGQKVFISGGAEGSAPLQFRSPNGWAAHVTTTASKRGEALVRSLGCERRSIITVQDISTRKSRFDADWTWLEAKRTRQDVRNHEA